jgi:hypothetical protein
MLGEMPIMALEERPVVVAEDWMRGFERPSGRPSRSGVLAVARVHVPSLAAGRRRLRNWASRPLIKGRQACA